MNLIKYLFLLLILQSLSAGEIKDQAEQQIRELQGPDITLSFTRISLPSEIKADIESSIRQRFFGDNIYSWEISRNDSLLGYALLDNVLGKSMPITFLVVFDTSGTVSAVRIVKYRESIGGSVSNHDWLRQFSRMSVSNVMEKEIDGITGATISVNAVSRGVRKLILLFPFVQKK